MTYPLTATPRVPRRPSESTPQSGAAKITTSSSTKPRVPTMSPIGGEMCRRSVRTNETDEFRNTKKEIEKRATPKRYVAACNGRMCGENGRWEARLGAISSRSLGGVCLVREGEEDREGSIPRGGEVGWNSAVSR